MGEGLLDFIKTPEGQGLLSGLFGYAANAQQGTPWNNFGRGGVAGLMGYGNALERQDTLAQREQAKKLQDLQMQQAQNSIDEQKRKVDEAARQRKWREGLPGAMNQKVYGSSDVGPTMEQDTNALNNYLMQADSPFADKVLEQKLFAKPEAYTLGEGQTRYVGNKVVARGSEKADPKTDIAKLAAERDALPVGHPMRKVYDNAITKATTHQPAAMAVSYGSPVPIQLPGGVTGYAQPGNRPGAAPQLMVGADNKPMLKPKDNGTKPAEMQRMDLAGQTMGQLLNDYETFLTKNNPRDPMVQMNPAKRAEMQSLHKNIQLQFKELQALGALAGPDLEIMEAALSDPFSVKGAYYGPSGLKAQIGQARKLIDLRLGKPTSQTPSGDIRAQADAILGGR